jgi:hypothetical protein
MIAIPAADDCGSLHGLVCFLLAETGFAHLSSKHGKLPGSGTDTTGRKARKSAPKAPARPNRYVDISRLARNARPRAREVEQFRHSRSNPGWRSSWAKA